MSVAYDILLAMNKNKETWFKWDYVCPNCDAHIEMTLKSNGLPHSEICSKCYERMTLMSVVDATIDPTTKKEDEMETLTPAPQTMTLNWIENDVETTKTYTESDVRTMVWSNKGNNTKINEYYRKESQLRTLLEEVYADSEEQEVLSQIANIFDVPLTKEIEVTAYIRVDLTVEVDMATGDFDVEDFVSSNLTVDSYAGEISVNNHEVERVEEGAY